MSLSDVSLNEVGRWSAPGWELLTRIEAARGEEARTAAVAAVSAALAEGRIGWDEAARIEAEVAAVIRAAPAVTGGGRKGWKSPRADLAGAERRAFDDLLAAEKEAARAASLAEAAEGEAAGAAAEAAEAAAARAKAARAKAERERRRAETARLAVEDLERRRAKRAARIKGMARKRMLGGGAKMPNQLRAEFTEGERAVLAVIGEAIVKRDPCRLAAPCDLSVGQLASRAGVSRTTAQNALRAARRAGALRITHRRRGKTRNDTNLVWIVSVPWLNWLRTARAIDLDRLARARRKADLRHGAGVGSEKQKTEQIEDVILRRAEKKGRKRPAWRG